MSEQDNMDKFDKILSQVRALIAKADSTDHEGEEELLRAKAEQLMLKYRIEEALVFEKAIGTADAITPVWLTIQMQSIGSDYYTHYSRIAGAILRHAGGRGVISHDYESNRVVLKAVGFSSDLRYADLLITSCMLEFGKRLEPKVDVNASDEENAWNLRSAGWTRKRIARELLGPWDTENEMKAKNRRITAMIKRYGEKIGEDPNVMLGRGNNMNTYAESYADGFVNTINHRLWRMRQQAQEMEGGALVPVSRAEAVDEAYYAQYPQHRPTETKPFFCEKCSKAKSGYCRDHQFLRPRMGREKSVNSRAYDRGRTAAHSVDLGTHGSGRGIEG